MVTVVSFTFVMRLKDEDVVYLDACARIRGLRRSNLMRRIIRKTLADQLIPSVLDDIQFKLETSTGRQIPSRRRRTKSTQ